MFCSRLQVAAKITDNALPLPPTIIIMFSFSFFFHESNPRPNHILFLQKRIFFIPQKTRRIFYKTHPGKIQSVYLWIFQYFPLPMFQQKLDIHIRQLSSSRDAASGTPNHQMDWCSRIYRSSSFLRISCGTSTLT